METAPRVSTVLRDLQRILFFLIMLATIVKLVVKAIGNPSGMNATALPWSVFHGWHVRVELSYRR
jgi:hypothetical protein